MMMVIQRLDNQTQGMLGYRCPLAMHQMGQQMMQRYLAGPMAGEQMDNRVLTEMFVGLHRMRYRCQAEQNCVMMVDCGLLAMLTHGH